MEKQNHRLQWKYNHTLICRHDNSPRRVVDMYTDNAIMLRKLQSYQEVKEKQKRKAGQKAECIRVLHPVTFAAVACYFDFIRNQLWAKSFLKINYKL